MTPQERHLPGRAAVPGQGHQQRPAAAPRASTSAASSSSGSPPGPSRRCRSPAPRAASSRAVSRADKSRWVSTTPAPGGIALPRHQHRGRRRRAEEGLRGGLQDAQAEPRRADLPQLRAAGRPDRRRRHARHHPVRRAGDQQGLDREAPQGDQPAGPGRLLLLGQQPGGALATAYLLAPGHRRHGQRRHRRRPRGQRHLRSEGPQHEVPRRRRDGQQGRHEQPPDARLPQRQAAPHDPDHHRAAARSSPPVRA